MNKQQFDNHMTKVFQLTIGDLMSIENDKRYNGLISTENLDNLYYDLLDSKKFQKFLSKRKIKKEKLYNIYINDFYKRSPLYLATTNNLKKWLKKDNEYREEPEKLDDFIIKECKTYLY